MLSSDFDARINSLCGKTVMPTNSDVCTATVLSVEWAQSEADEMAEVQYHSQDDCKAVITRYAEKEKESRDVCSRFQAELAKETSAQMVARVMKETAGSLGSAAGINNDLGSNGHSLMEAACKDAKQAKQHLLEAKQFMQAVPESRKLQIDTSIDMEKYASAVNVQADRESTVNILPEFVKKIALKRHSPVLRHVSIIDTPGQLDVHETRAKIAIKGKSVR